MRIDRLKLGFATLLVAGGIAGVLAFAASSARAQIIQDPLHGVCNGTVPAGACADNGVNTPLGSNSTRFGFSLSSAGATGTTGELFLDLLVPNNDPTPASFSITGTNGGPANNTAIAATATLVSATAWTSGNLADYLKFVAQPDNAIGAYLPTTQILDPGSTGFFVYQVDLGQQNLFAPGAASNPPNFTYPIAGFSSDIGGYILGFFDPGPATTCMTPKTQGKVECIATANSGALLVNGERLPPIVPEPPSLVLLGTALAILGLFGRRRSA